MYLANKRVMFSGMQTLHQINDIWHFASPCYRWLDKIWWRGYWRAVLSLHWPGYNKHYAVYSVQFSVQGSVYSVQCTVYRVQCTVYSVKCTVCSEQWTVYNVQCAVYIDHCSVQCTVCSVQCTVHNVQCAVYIDHCTVITARPVLITGQYWSLARLLCISLTGHVQYGYWPLASNDIFYGKTKGGRVVNVVLRELQCQKPDTISV